MPYIDFSKVWHFEYQILCITIIKNIGIANIFNIKAVIK